MNATTSQLIPDNLPVGIDTIVYLREDINYARVYLNSGKKLVVSAALLTVEHRLTNFLRISPKYLINPSHITQYKLICHKHLMIGLSNGTNLLVPRRQTRRILAYLQPSSVLLNQGISQVRYPSTTYTQ